MVFEKFGEEATPMKVTAIAVAVLMATLTLAGAGQAQGVITVQGTIAAVDCHTNALVLNAVDGTHVFPSGPYTTVFVNSTPESFCSLSQFVGSNATVSVGAYGNQLVAERVDVYVAAIPVPVAPAVVYPVYTGISPVAGVLLGTIIVAGLAFLLIRAGDGHVWRVPYDHWPRYTRVRPIYPGRPGWRAPVYYEPYRGPRPVVPAYEPYRDPRPQAPAYQPYRDPRPQVPAFQPHRDPQATTYERDYREHHHSPAYQPHRDSRPEAPAFQPYRNHGGPSYERGRSQQCQGVNSNGACQQYQR